MSDEYTHCPRCGEALVVQGEVWAGYSQAGRDASRRQFVKALGEDAALAIDAHRGRLVCPRGHASPPEIRDGPHLHCLEPAHDAWLCREPGCDRAVIRGNVYALYSGGPAFDLRDAIVAQQQHDALRQAGAHWNVQLAWCPSRMCQQAAADLRRALQ